MICLNMVVKDELPVIGRCLESVRPFIDSFVIVDTGSTDGTLEAVEKALDGLPGVCYQRPWVDFGTNRTEALRLAQAFLRTRSGRGSRKYLLFIDADETAEGQLPDYQTADVWNIHYQGNLDYALPRLVNAELPWGYRGAVHEYLWCDIPHSTRNCESLSFVNHGDGHRNPTREVDNLRLCEKAYSDDQNDRNTFYLARSYQDTGEAQKACGFYSKRAAMGGWDQEVFYSLWQAGLIELAEGYGNDFGLTDLLRAYQACPTRAESLHSLANWHRTHDNHALAEMFAEQGLKVGYPKDGLFVDRSVYEWGLLFELSISAFYTGHKGRAAWAAKRVLECETTPANIRRQVEVNSVHY